MLEQLYASPLSLQPTRTFELVIFGVLRSTLEARDTAVPQEPLVVKVMAGSLRSLVVKEEIREFLERDVNDAWVSRESPRVRSPSEISFETLSKSLGSNIARQI